MSLSPRRVCAHGVHSSAGISGYTATVRRYKHILCVRARSHFTANRNANRISFIHLRMVVAPPQRETYGAAVVWHVPLPHSCNSNSHRECLFHTISTAHERSRIRPSTRLRGFLVDAATGMRPKSAQRSTPSFLRSKLLLVSLWCISISVHLGFEQIAKSHYITVCCARTNGYCFSCVLCDVCDWCNWHCIVSHRWHHPNKLFIDECDDGNCGRMTASR